MPTDTIARALAARIPAAVPTTGWATAFTAPGAQYAQAVSTDGTRIYRSGGLNSGAVISGADTFATDGTRTNLPAPTTARAYAAGVFCNGKHYSIGGANGGTYYGLVEVYTPAGSDGASGTWTKLTNDSYGRSAASATAIGNYIYVAGGTNAANNSSGPNAADAQSTVQRYNTANGLTGTWESLPNMPAARYGGALVAVGTKLYYLGGLTSSGAGASTVYVYDTANGTSGTWATATALSQTFPGTSATVIGTTIYLTLQDQGFTYNTTTGATAVIGSYPSTHGTYAGTVLIGSKVFAVTGSSSANVDVLDTAAAADLVISGWSTIGALPAIRYAAAVSTDGTNIFATHGNAAGSNTAGGVSITPAGTVTALAGAAGGAARLGVAGGWCNGRHFAVGGLSGSAASVAVDSYSPAGTNGAAGTWATENALPTAVAYASAATIGTDLYVAGGQTGSAATSAVAAVVRYGSNNRWSTVAAMPAARTQGALVVLGGKLYFLNGYDSSGNTSASVFIYDPVLGTWSTGTPTPVAAATTPAVALNNQIFKLAGNRILATWDGTKWTSDNSATPTTPVGPGNTIGHGSWAGAVGIGSLLYYVSGSDNPNVDVIEAGFAGTTPFGRRIRLLQQYLAGTDVVAFSVAKRLPLTAPSPATWKTLGALPALRSSAAVSTDGSRVYVSNGYQDSNTAIQQAGYVISAAGVAATLPSSGAQKWKCAGAWCNGKHYSIAGQPQGSTSTSAVVAYTPAGSDGASGSWASAGDFYSALYPAAAVIGTKIYVAGGQVSSGNNQALNLFHVRDMATSATSSTALATMPSGRSRGALVAVGTKLYYVGGIDGSGALQSSVFVYDTATGTWSTLALNSGNSGYQAATVLGSTIYAWVTNNGAVAGWDTAANPTAPTFITVTGVPEHGDFPGLVTLGSQVAVVGGTNTANVDAVDPVSGPAYVANVRRLRAVLAA